MQKLNPEDRAEHRSPTAYLISIHLWSYEQVEVMIVYLKLSTYFTEWHISEERIQYYCFVISKLLFPKLKPESFWIKREYL